VENSVAWHRINKVGFGRQGNVASYYKITGRTIEVWIRNSGKREKRDSD